MPLEPLICRSRYRNVKKSYKNQKVFGGSKKRRIFVVLKATRVLTVPHGIGSIYFVGETEEDAKEKAKKYLEKTYKNGFEIL